MNDTYLSPAELPSLSDASAHTRVARVGLDCACAPLRILVAEDNGTLRRLLGLVLRRDGHDVVEASDAGELLDVLASSWIEGDGGGGAPIDLVICEHALPGMAGLTVLAGLRSRDSETPFILMTGNEDVQRSARRLRGVVLDHPFNVAAIRAAIRQSADLARIAND